MVARSCRWMIGSMLALVSLACGSSESPAPPAGAQPTPGTRAVPPTQPTTGTQPVAGGGADRPLHLAFVTNNPSDFWSIARAGTEKARAELPNVRVTFQLADGTAANQRQIIDNLLSVGVDGIAISPNDPENQTEYLNEVAARTLLITQDSDAPRSNRACYIGTDNKAAGVQAGQIIREALPNGGKIRVFVGDMSVQNAQDRFAGIREALAGSNIEIIDVLTDATDQVRAKANALETLVQYPDIACLVGLWSYNGPAIVSAVQEVNKVGQVKIVCFDEDPATLQGVKNGAIYATVVQQPFEFGYQAIKLMAAYLRGDRSVFPPNKVIIIPTLRVDRSNVDAFWENLKKLRGQS